MTGALRKRAESSLSALNEALGAQRRLWPSYKLEQVGGFDRRWRSAETFFTDRTAIEDLLASQQNSLPGLDRKGMAAFAIGAYSYTLAAGLVPLFVGFRILPDFRDSNLAVALEPNGGSGALRLHLALTGTNIATDSIATGQSGEDVLKMGSDMLCERFRTQLEDHLTPLIAHLHAATRLSYAALWRLVADYFAQLFLDAGKVFGQERRAQADALQILKQTHSPLANAQLHFFDLAMEDCEASKTFVSRGGCCRQYTVDGCELCTTCVLQNPAARDFAVRKQLSA